MVNKTFMVGVLGIVLFLTEKRDILGDAKTSVSYSHLYLLLKASQNIFKFFEFVHPTKHNKYTENIWIPHRRDKSLQTNQQVDIKRICLKFIHCVSSAKQKRKFTAVQQPPHSKVKTTPQK